MTKVLRETMAVGATAEEIKAEGLSVNRAGGPSYTSSDRQALVTYLTTGGVGSTFYADKTTLATEARKLFVQFAGSDPEFLAKAAVYARAKGLMRTNPIEALAYLSLGGATAHRAFHAIFGRVIQTPGDLADFWALHRGPNKVRGVGRATRTATETWLAQMSAYHAIKYGASSQTMSLRDIYRMARPKLSGAPAGIASYLVKGEITPDTPEQLCGYHAFKNATADIDTLLAMVATHRLPWEVVSGQLGGGDGAERAKVWAAMSLQMPYMALLRNLNNLLKYGVLEDAETRKLVLGRLSDQKNVLASKQFPFRFISAIRAVQQAHGVGETANAVVEALKVALDHSVSNMPFTNQRVLSVLDVSGSMSSAQAGVGAYGARGGRGASEPITCADIGSVFAAATYKAAIAGGGVGDIITFDTEARWASDLEASPSQGVYDIAKRIHRSGGGTSLWTPIHAALTSGKAYDVMVFITDSESWAGEMSGSGHYGWTRRPKQTGSQAALDAYRQQVNPDARVFFVQLVPTSTQMTAPDQPNTWYISGWSNSVLDFIALQAERGTSQLEAIAAIEL